MDGLYLLGAFTNIRCTQGTSFKDIVALNGKPDIGGKINAPIIQLFIDANPRLARSNFPDFNDPNKRSA